MKRSCPANEFFYVIEELKVFRALAKSKKTEGGNFLKFQKEFFD
jgi:hypothetical protein